MAIRDSVDDCFMDIKTLEAQSVWVARPSPSTPVFTVFMAWNQGQALVSESESGASLCG